MTPQFRHTIYNTALYPSGVIVNEPLGWKDVVISLTRDKEFNSLIEFFKGNFIWYGTGRDVLMEIEADQGLDAIVRVLIQINYGDGFNTIFDGLIDLSQLEDISKADKAYKTSAPIIRDSLWSKFMNRINTPVNLESTTDLDGGTRDAIAKIVLPLTSQSFRNTFERDNTFSVADFGTIGTGGGVIVYLMWSNSRFILDEIKDRKEVGTQVNNNLPTGSNRFYYFKVLSDGDYHVEAGARYSITLDPSQTFDLKWYYVLRQADVLGTPVQFGSTQSGTGDFDDDGVRTMDEVFTLIAGDEIYVYGKLSLGGAADVEYKSDYDSGGDIHTSFKVTSATTYPTTNTDAFLIKDAAESILSKIIGVDDVLTSGTLNDCKKLNAITRGKNIRGYDFSTKEFSMSFKNWWDGASNLLALGLGYTDGGNIEILPIADFYDNTPVINFSNVPDLVRTYSVDHYLKSLEIGFVKWSAESDSGFDDPQTKHWRRTKFATIGKDDKILCSWMAASLAIEQTRRNRIELGKDWRLDEDIMVIALKDLGGGDYTPELDENFDTVTNLINSETRYNIRHTPERMFLKWRSYLNGCLQHLPSEFFYFSKGEGNYSVTTKMDGADCEVTPEDSSSLVGNQDIDVTTDYLFIPKIYKCKIPMSFENYTTIKSNRNKAIGVSRSSSGFVPMFIMDLDFKVMDGNAECILLLGTNTDL